VPLALWLLPADPVRARCAEWIERLSRELSTPRFAPHVTLLHGIPRAASSVVAAAAALARATAPLQVRLGALRQRPEYHRALLVEVRGPGLHETHARAAAALGMAPASDFAPHLSLLYGSVPEAVKDALVDRIGRALEGTASLDRLDVVDTGGPPEAWNACASVALGGE
jgi:2'-5' RNA ligase